MTKSVLLVEDDPVQLELISRFLKADLGVEVLPAGSSEEALAHLDDPSLVAVLSDLWLPGRSGLELADDIKARRPEVQVVMMTAYNDATVALAILRANVDGFLEKPIKRDALRRRFHGLAHSRKQRTVVAIGAHPDDVEIGCGGTLIAHAQRGDRVVVVTLTGGEVGGGVQERRAEAQASSDLMGVELVHLSLPDTRLAEQLSLVPQLEAIVKELQPEVVYTHSARDVHQDHRAANAATLVAARSVPTVLCYQSPSTTIEFRPSMFFDISHTIQAKLSAIAAFESQTRRCAYLEEDLILATARYWGRYAQKRAVEPFEVVRQTAAVDDDNARMPIEVRA